MASENPVEERAVILIVEDDFFLLMLAVDMVEEAGFATITATNADEAVTLLEEREDIRVVFTDINMPGSMDGLKLAQAVRHRWPPIELILTSGKFSVAPEDIPERAQFFAKPYRSDQVISAMRQFMTDNPPH